MTHYIADCGSFCHVLTINDFPDPKPLSAEKMIVHNQFESLIFGDKKKQIIMTNDHNNREPEGGFIYKKNFIISNQKPFRPEPTVFQCALCVAFDTRWDYQLTYPSELSL